LFFGDARLAIAALMYVDVVYADDLNAYRIFGAGEGNERLFKSMKSCQQELHLWGEANQVSFDPSKESIFLHCGSRREQISMYLESSLMGRSA
jgi:hypothetical protein